MNLRMGEEYVHTAKTLAFKMFGSHINGNLKKQIIHKLVKFKIRLV